MEEKKKKVLASQTSLTIRIVVGAYILYNMYQVYTSDSEKSVFIIIMMVLLSLISLVLIVFSLKHFIMGEYVGGKADKSDSEGEPVDETVSEPVDETVSETVDETVSETVDETDNITSVETQTEPVLQGENQTGEVLTESAQSDNTSMEEEQ